MRRYGIPRAAIKAARARALAIWPEIGNKPHKTAKRPKIRLAKLHPKHARMIEVLRLVLHRQPCDPASSTHVLELARRGMFDAVDDFVWENGEPVPNPTTLRRIRSDVLELCLLGLMVVLGGGRSTTLGVTQDGIATLADWDDPTADGVYPRVSRD